MSLRNTSDRWGTIARTLHWGIALLIVGLVVMGLAMEEMENSPQKFELYTLHKSAGLLVLALVLCRIIWRLADPAPSPPATTPRWQLAAATLVHWALYGLLLALPLSGYAYSSMGGYPFNWFNIQGLGVPLLISGPDTYKELAEETHKTLVVVLYLVLAAHVGAALFHHFVRRDAVLARMTPFIRPFGGK